MAGLAFDIECSFEEGPVYKNLEIRPTGRASFYLTSSSASEEQKKHGIELHIDGEKVTSLSIEDYGFTLKDFDDVPLNKFGLKEIASYGEEVLVVTADSKFVMYSAGIPSLQGLPCDIQLISGVWVNFQRDLVGPKLTLFSGAQYKELFEVAVKHSFRTIKQTSDCLSKVITTGTVGEIVSSAGALEDKLGYSLYAHLYPEVNEHQYQLFQTLLAEASGTYRTSGSLSSIVLS